VKCLGKQGGNPALHRPSRNRVQFSTWGVARWHSRLSEITQKSTVVVEVKSNEEYLFIQERELLFQHRCDDVEGRSCGAWWRVRDLGGIYNWLIVVFTFLGIELCEFDCCFLCVCDCVCLPPFTWVNIRDSWSHITDCLCVALKDFLLLVNWYMALFSRLICIYLKLWEFTNCISPRSVSFILFILFSLLSFSL